MRQLIIGAFFVLFVVGCSAKTKFSIGENDTPQVYDNNSIFTKADSDEDFRGVQYDFTDTPDFMLGDIQIVDLNFLGGRIVFYDGFKQEKTIYAVFKGRSSFNELVDRVKKSSTTKTMTCKNNGGRKGEKLSCGDTKTSTFISVVYEPLTDITDLVFNQL